MLSRCIATDAGSFATQYWGRRPLLSRSGALPRDFSDLLSPSAVDELIAQRGVRAPFIRMARNGDLLDRECYLGPAGFGAEIADQVDSDKVLTEFASGATIVLQGLHRLWPPVIEFVRGVVDDVGHPTQANAYVTPAASRGFDPHYDVHDVFVLQVAGEKRWIVHQPVHDNPLPSQPWTERRAAISERVDGAPVIDTALAAGDALYLPRGWIHSAHALDTTSIHLTIGISTSTGLDIVQAVVDALTVVDEFRESLPIGIDPANHDEMTAMATKVIFEVADTLRHRATELGESAGVQLSRRHSQRTRPMSVRPLAALAAAEHADVVTVRWRPGLGSTIDRHCGRLLLRLRDKTMTFPNSCALAVEALRGGLIADADSLPGLDRADSTVLIRRLLREGIVIPAHEHPTSIPTERG
ncbi:cupin domain-containing protein [Mycolicibacterium sp. XJ879]